MSTTEEARTPEAIRANLVVLRPDLTLDDFRTVDTITGHVPRSLK